MKNLGWYYHRLRAMSFLEISYRVKQKVKKEKYKRKYAASVSILEIDRKIELSNVTELKQQLNSFFHFDLLKEASYSKTLKIFNKEYMLNDNINWHSGMYGEWPKEKYSFDISFKNQDEIGDIRFTWEINRHLFFVNLALQFRFNQDHHALLRLKEYFYDWIEKNPFLKGVNWTSSMEVAIRAYQWMITYCILKDIIDEQFLKDLLVGIKNSTTYVMNNLSLHSSANNHLILEVAISSIIGYFLNPVFEQSWFEEGYDILLTQIPLQVYDDGVNKEQGVHYHAFVLDMLIQYNYFLRSINKPTLHEELLKKMVGFLGYLNQGGKVTEIGDSDDAKIIDLTGQEKCYYKYLLQLASQYYEEQFIELEKKYPEVILFNAKMSQNSPKYEYSAFQEYPKGGYSFLQYSQDYLIFDTGPLGFGSISAHGHADALSLVYHYNNQPILVDPGTYIYNIQRKWRDYFRKTSSHNTLSVENIDQSTMNGPFLWSKKANAKLINSGETSNLYYMEGMQDGYTPALHRRAITYMKKEGIIIIVDNFSNKGQINFTFDSGITIDPINETHIYLDNKNLFMSFSQPYKIVEKWISMKFLEKERSLGIQVNHDFVKQDLAFTIISKGEPVLLKNNEFSYKGITYVYESYKNIRSVKR